MSKAQATSGVAHSQRVELTAELDRLSELLREIGAVEVWLFGSLARGEVHEASKSWGPTSSARL